MKRVAFCLRGAVSKYNNRFLNPGDIYQESSSYINIRAVYNSIQHHIIKVNPAYQFDFFIQSWNPDLKTMLSDLYQPVSTIFENNQLYSEEIQSKCAPGIIFAGVSQCLGMKKGLNLVQEYEDKNNTKYDIVILYRPDVLLWKDMNLNEYDVERHIYMNGHSLGWKTGDLHFVMSSYHSRKFSTLYEWLSIDHPFIAHQTIPYFIEHELHLSLRNDSIFVLIHQDCLRNIHPRELSRMTHFGITEEDYYYTKVYTFTTLVCLASVLSFIILLSLCVYRTLFHPVVYLLLILSPLYYLFYYRYGVFYGTVGVLTLMFLIIIGFYSNHVRSK
jgi:hypothetical protein